MESIFIQGLTNPSVWSIIILILYIGYNEFKRMCESKTNLVEDKLQLAIKLAKEEEKDRIDDKHKAYNEIERYLINKCKHFKAVIMNRLDIEPVCINGKETNCIRMGRDGCIRSAAHGILLKAMIKIEKDIMTQIIENGYHELSTVSLEEYITYVTEQIYDTLTNRLVSTEHTVPLIQYINKSELKDVIRNVFETSINIKDRAKI